MKMKKRFIARNWKRLLAFSLILVVILKLSFAGPYRPVEPLPSDIVDMHCHVAGIGSGGSGCFVSPKLRDNWKFGIYLRAFGVSRSEMEEKGDGLVVDRISESLAQSKFVRRAVVLALDG